MWGRSHLQDAMVLCVTEMLANVYRHVESPECELTLRNLPEGVRASVSDTSPAPPVVITHPDWREENGRGTFLLANIADRWGVLATEEGGKLVWVLVEDAS